jgi:neutral ceramidase
MLKKIFRYVLIFLLTILGLLLVFLAISIAPVERSLPQEHAYYEEMLSSIKPQHPVAGHRYRVGYAKENFTPSHPTSLAGYGNRWGKVYDRVQDSIFVRAIVIDNGSARVAIVSADLLLMPPTVRRRLEEILPDIGFSLDNTYLGATHTHNSIGNWGEGAAGFIYGPYEDSVVSFIADKIKTCIARAAKDLVPATLAHGQLPVDDPVKNRLTKNGPVDSLLRVVEVTRDDSVKLLLMAYTAHPTCLYSKDLGLSRDYPGKLVDEIESRGYTFAMFMAGSVGSHGCNPPKYGEPCVEWMADQIADDFEQYKTSLQPLHDSTLFMYRVPLSLGEAQAKIAKDWRIREWLFSAAFGEYQAYLNALRVGDVVLLGTPCDFSGEFNAHLDTIARTHGLSPIVTSFNGAYIGYVTPLKYYDEDHYETQLMNWYGPGTGEYLVSCLEKMIEAVGGKENQPESASKH